MIRPIPASNFFGFILQGDFHGDVQIFISAYKIVGSGERNIHLILKINIYGHGMYKKKTDGRYNERRRNKFIPDDKKPDRTLATNLLFHSTFQNIINPFDN